MIRAKRVWRAAGAAGGAVALAGLASVAAVAGCVEQDEDAPTEEDMKTIKANILAAPPTPRFIANADLDGKLIYLGMDADPPQVEPGKDVKLTHYWKCVSPPGEGWRIFTHIAGPRNANFINADHGPIGGKYALSQWKAGEIIRDEHTVKVPATWAHPEFIVYVGSWGRAGPRMPVRSGPSDGDRRVIAASLPVKMAAKPEPPRKRYIARKTPKPIKIDGKLDDAPWQSVPSTGPFSDTMSGAPVDQRTEAKILWDDKFLYVAFENTDTNVWSSLGKRDDKLWTEEADELMIDADGNGRGYVELQVAPNGTVFDTYLPEYRKYEDALDPKKKQFSWNSKVNAKVVVNGTLNKHGDQDKGWTVEMAIPLEDVKGMEPKAELPKLPPALGNVWRINLFRMDRPDEKQPMQKASGWSPPLVGDFHKLDRFGELVFADEHGSIAPPPVPVTPVPLEPAVKGGAKKAADKRGPATVAPKDKDKDKDKGKVLAPAPK
jgi:hypothetical protein